MAASPKLEMRSESQTRMPLSSPVIELANYQRLVARVVDVFGDEVKASTWLSQPNRDLQGKTPLQTVRSVGYDGQVLEPILIRIEHGIDF